MPVYNNSDKFLRAVPLEKVNSHQSMPLKKRDPMFPGVGLGYDPAYIGTKYKHDPAFPGVGKKPDPAFPGVGLDHDPAYPGAGRKPDPMFPGVGRKHDPAFPGIGKKPDPAFPGLGKKPYPMFPGVGLDHDPAFPGVRKSRTGQQNSVTNSRHGLGSKTPPPPSFKLNQVQNFTRGFGSKTPQVHNFKFGFGANRKVPSWRSSTSGTSTNLNDPDVQRGLAESARVDRENRLRIGAEEYENERRIHQMNRENAEQVGTMLYESDLNGQLAERTRRRRLLELKARWVDLWRRGEEESER